MGKTGDLFISNLRRLRKAQGLSQDEFAIKVSLSLRGYQKYEQGESSPTPEVIDRFAKALGCTPFDLLDAPGQIRPVKGDIFRNLLSSLAMLSDRQLEIIQSQVDSLLRAQGTATLSQKKAKASGET